MTFNNRTHEHMSHTQMDKHMIHSIINHLKRITAFLKILCIFLPPSLFHHLIVNLFPPVSLAGYAWPYWSNGSDWQTWPPGMYYKTISWQTQHSTINIFFHFLSKILSALFIVHSSEERCGALDYCAKFEINILFSFSFFFFQGPPGVSGLKGESGESGPQVRDAEIVLVLVLHSVSEKQTTIAEQDASETGVDINGCILFPDWFRHYRCRNNKDNASVFSCQGPRGPMGSLGPSGKPGRRVRVVNSKELKCKLSESTC